MHDRLVTPAQLRTGRALPGLFRAKLAGRTCLPLTTIQLAEAEGARGAPEAAMAAKRVALEDHGVVFLEGGDERPGVRLRRSGARPRS